MKKMLMTVISLVLVICIMMPSVYAAADSQTSYDSVMDYVTDAQSNDETDSKIRFGRFVNGLSNFVINDFLGTVQIENNIIVLLGKTSVADNFILKDNFSRYYTVSEVGYLEIGDEMKVYMSPGETFGELVFGGKGAEGFELAHVREYTGEGHNSQTALFIDGVEIKGDADDFFRAFPYRHTRFTDSSWSI